MTEFTENKTITRKNEMRGKKRRGLVSYIFFLDVTQFCSSFRFDVI